MTIRVQVIRALKFSGKPMTAMQLHAVIAGPLGHPPLGSLAGELHKMAARGILQRKDGFGPRGGYGYTLTDPDAWEGPPTAWSFILGDPLE
jgi:hypothetical protein